MNPKILKTNSGNLKLPAFLPDATLSYIRGLDSQDLENTKTSGVVVNTYHLLANNLINTIKKAGGIHKYMNYHNTIVSDSGGFQVMSLIRKDKKFGHFYNQGVIFYHNNNKHVLTPERCIKLQLDIGADILMCLDDPTYPEEIFKEQKLSVERTISWAKKCKSEFEKLTKNSKKKPKLFAIIQGGSNKDLRKHCAEELIKIGFDGYAFGGWPAENGKFLYHLLHYTARLMPNSNIKYAMGIGFPEDIAFCFNSGYNLFDCVIPTREARNNRLYIFKKDPKKLTFKELQSKKFYEHFRARNSKNQSDLNPISKFCDCHTCKNYSKSYIYNLFKQKDTLAIRLATIHNLRFYSQLIEILRKK
ncbi:MAG: tRNA guanosine(34) transglycosylase Tgt [Nanoarchaeota archaeon]